MPIIGFGILEQTASSNTVLQTLVEDHMRGRVMSLYSMAFLGMVPLGSLLAGYLARLMGAPATVMVNGVLCLAAALIFFRQRKALNRHIHLIYMKKGIIVDETVRMPKPNAM